MPLPIQPTAARGFGPVTGGLFRDPSGLTEVFLGAFRRDLLSFYPGCRLETEPALALAVKPALGTRVSPSLPLDFHLDEEDESPRDSVRVSLFGIWYRLSVPRSLGLGPRDRELIRAIGRVMELHHQVLFRWSRVSLLQLRRGMPEDHYVAASVDPSAYSPTASLPSRIAEAILTLRTMALSTYENRRVTTGAIIVGPESHAGTGRTGDIGNPAPEALEFGVELTGVKTLHRLCDGRRTLFLVDRQGKLADLVDIRHWAVCAARAANDLPPRVTTDQSTRGDEPEPVLAIPCPRVYTFHALATRTGGHVCLVLSPNQEIKVFAAGVQAFVFAHGRWRVLDPESKYALWERAVANHQLARVLLQTALDLAEERQGGLLVVVSDPAQAIGRLLAPHDVLEPVEAELEEDAIEAESPALVYPVRVLPSLAETVPANAETPLSWNTPLPSRSEPLSKRSVHYLARQRFVTALDPAVLEALAGLDGALVTDPDGQLLAFGAILRHDAHSLAGPESTFPPAIAEGARTTAALAASRFGPVLKISEDGIVSCFLDGARIWDL
jgi:hypothetical protein